MSRRIRRTTCDHKWKAIYNPADDVAAYNDGFNYRPGFEACTRCGRTRRIRYEPWPDWRFILSFPFIFIGVIVWSILVPISILVIGIYEALFPKRKS